MTDNKKMSQQVSSIFDDAYKEEDPFTRFIRKSKEEPFMPAGIAGGLGALAYAVYKWRHRGKMSTSIYLIQTRVAVQGMVVSALTAGVAYSLYRDYIAKPAETTSETKK